MRLKKNLSEMVKTDYVPLTTTQEGNLQGGFGSITLSTLGDVSDNDVNGVCKNRTCLNGECANPSCANECANPTCVNQCTINICGTTATPKPTTSTANFLIGI